MTTRRVVPLIRSLKRAVAETGRYHDAGSPADTLVYSFVLKELGGDRRRSRPPSEEELRLLLNGYLREWCGLRRLLGSEPNEDNDPVLYGLRKALRASKGTLRMLSDCRIEEQLEDNQRRSLVLLFEHLNGSWKGLSGKSKRSSVATAKLLHILLPRLCVIWDREYVLKLRFEREEGEPRGFPDSAEGYVSYLDHKRANLALLAKSSGLPIDTAANRLRSMHFDYVRRMFPDVEGWPSEPVTKILDELNYAGS